MGEGDCVLVETLDKQELAVAAGSLPVKGTLVMFAAAADSEGIFRRKPVATPCCYVALRYDNNGWPVTSVRCGSLYRAAPRANLFPHGSIPFLRFFQICSIAFCTVFEYGNNYRSFGIWVLE
jgi:hypothetical protein